MLSAEGVFTFRKERPVEVSALVRLTLCESVDWARNKCPLTASTGVRIKRVEFRENVRASPRDKDNCP